MQRKTRITSVTIIVWHFHLESFYLYGGVKKVTELVGVGAEASYPLQIFVEFRLKGRRKGKNNNLTSAKTIKSLSWDEQLGGSLMFQDPDIFCDRLPDHTAL